MTDTPDLDMNRNRAAEFQRDQNLESVLAELNGAIVDALEPPYARPRHPVVMIVGNPRSGTTLASQWLSTLGPFAYPSNLLARFYANPYFGARVQQALIDFDQGSQLGLGGNTDFKSALGKTKGALAPSEFWYFWRRFFEFGEIQTLDDVALASTDRAGFLEGLAGLEAAFAKPVVTKAMIMNWHIPFLDEVLDKVLFLNIERDSFYNAQSLYHARERFFGDASRWYSFKPVEYAELKDKSIPEQLAGQVHYTRKAVRAGLSGIADSRKLTVRYEDFCADPAKVYSDICTRFAAQGHHLPQGYEGPKAFEVNNRVTLPKDMAEALKAALSALGC